MQLSHRLQSCGAAVSAHPAANRLKRKLIVRQQKRERGLPVFDLDLEVSHLLQARGLIPAREHFKPQVTGSGFTLLDIAMFARCQVNEEVEVANTNAQSFAACGIGRAGWGAGWQSFTLGRRNNTLNVII